MKLACVGSIDLPHSLKEVRIYPLWKRISSKIIKTKNLSIQVKDLTFR